MNETSRHDRITALVKEKLTCSAHSLDHVFRVHRLCLLLAKGETNVDLDILIPAALLHDIARVDESEDKTGTIDHAVLGAELAGEILRNLDYREDEIKKITHCIRTHRFRSENIPESIEAKILFDADKIDALGACGIARTFIFSGQSGQRMTPGDPETIQTNTGENGRVKDVSKHTPLMEYEMKFKKIPDKLHTRRGKEIALERLAFMKDYFQRLSREMLGEE